MFKGLAFAAVLVAFGVGTAYRQVRNRKVLAARTHVPSYELAYLRGQITRRLCVAAVLVLIGGMIGGSFVSGMEAQADDAEVDPLLYALFWIAVLLLVFVVTCLAIFDFWATRRYWMGIYRQLKNDHNTLLQRDLALYRRQRMEERESRIRRGLSGEGENV